MTMLKRSVVTALITAMAVMVCGRADAKLKVGYRVKPLKVRDAQNNPATMPSFGKKVITLFYTDPDVKDQNEPFRDALKAENLDKKYYRGLGVVNMKDTWKPNFAIRSVIRKKIAKFKSTILTDVDYTLRNKWGLGDCNEKDVVIVIGVDRKVKYLKIGKMSRGEIKKGVALVKKLIAEFKAKKTKGK